MESVSDRTIHLVMFIRSGSYNYTLGKFVTCGTRLGREDMYEEQGGYVCSRNGERM